jgi:hypothetical protein
MYQYLNYKYILQIKTELTDHGKTYTGDEGDDFNPAVFPCYSQQGRGSKQCSEAFNQSI